MRPQNVHKKSVYKHNDQLCHIAIILLKYAKTLKKLKAETL